MLISICIPTLNSSETIFECIESILIQTVKPHEIVICDGGSEDETVRIIEETLRDSDISTKIMIERDSRIGKARNLLVKETKGDLILWVDADILLPYNWIESHLKIHEEHAEVKILSGRWIECKKDEVFNITCKTTPLQKWNNLTQMACSMKREIFSVLNYDESFRWSEDWDFKISAFQRNIIPYFCPGIVIFHILPRFSQFSKKNLKKKIYDGNYISFLRKYGLWFIRNDPKYFFLFVVRIALIYAIPLSFLFPLIILLYPLIWGLFIIRKKSKLILFWEILRGVGEHLYLFKII